MAGQVMYLLTIEAAEITRVLQVLWARQAARSSEYQPTYNMDQQHQPGHTSRTAQLQHKTAQSRLITEVKDCKCLNYPTGFELHLSLTIALTAAEENNVK